MLKLLLYSVLLCGALVAQDKPHVVAQVGDQALVAAGGATAVVPGQVDADAPTPPAVIHWTSEGVDVTLTFEKQPGEGKKEFRERIKDEVDFWMGLFPKDVPPAK